MTSPFPPSTGVEDQSGSDLARAAPVVSPWTAPSAALARSSRRVRASAGRVFDSLSSADYRLFLVALFFSFAAIQVQTVAQGWLIYSLTGSSVALGVITSLWSVSLFVLSPLGGVVADRVDRKRLVAVTYSGTGLVLLVTAALVITGTIQVWHLAVASLLSGGLFAFNLPGRLALIRDQVGERGLINAMALNSMVFNVSGFLFPPLAGLAVDHVGVGGVFGITAATYFLVVGIVAVLPRTQGSNLGGLTLGGSLVADIVEGAAVVRRSRPLMGLFLLGFLGVLLGSSYMTLLPALAAEVLHAPASVLGLMVAAGGLGALAGNVLVAGQRSDARLGRAMVLLGVGFGVALIALALPRTVLPALAALFAVGLIGMPFLTINQALVQKLAPAPVQGRVMSLYMLTWGLTPVAVLPLTALADAAGVPVAIAASGVALVGGVLALSSLRFGVTRI